MSDTRATYWHGEFKKTQHENESLRAQLAECEESNKAVELALDDVDYKGSYTDGIRYLIAQLAEKDKKLAEQIQISLTYQQHYYNTLDKLTVAHEEGRKEGYRQRNNELAERKAVAHIIVFNGEYDEFGYGEGNADLSLGEECLQLISRPERIEP